MISKLGFSFICIMKYHSSVETISEMICVSLDRSSKRRFYSVPNTINSSPHIRPQTHFHLLSFCWTLLNHWFYFCALKSPKMIILDSVSSWRKHYFSSMEDFLKICSDSQRFSLISASYSAQLLQVDLSISNLFS